MSKKKTKIIIQKHGFNEHYLTWQIGNCSANTAHILGLIRFIILVIMLPALIVTLIYIPRKLGYGTFQSS